MEALTPLVRLGTFSWIVTRDSHKKILNSQPWSRPPGRGLGRGPQVENRCSIDKSQGISCYRYAIFNRQNEKKKKITVYRIDGTGYHFHNWYRLSFNIPKLNQGLCIW